jgi:hypothetical protein
MSIRRSACAADAGALAQMHAHAKHAAPSALKVGWKVTSCRPGFVRTGANTLARRYIG